MAQLMLEVINSKLLQYRRKNDTKETPCALSYAALFYWLSVH